ncbi:putative eka-like protein [Erysiphe necator]|uniref:Putative eka-like protein n=1 Tax=Uncinula necator TaxID=52586 RepID=A0A0B1P8U3_UNCNE|nr:putative eka-like protein [Erysiphe necator]
MAKTIHAHLRTAISQFAISETCAPPLEFSQQTKGVKINAISNMNLPKKPTVAATHRINATLKTANALPKVPKTTPMLWTTVVRNGQKKTRLNEVPDATTDTNLQPQKCAAKTTFNIAQNQNQSQKNKKQLKSTDDMRLFVRLSKEHEWRKLSPAGIRDVVVKKLSISPTSIGLIKPVRTGFALSPRNNEAREALLKLSLRLSSFGAKLEPATSWLPVIIPTVPRYIRTEKGQVEVTKELLSDEIERVTSMRPNSIKLNCGGPHRSDSRKCLARPTRNGAPTKEQLKSIRLAGDRKFQAVLRAKAAEERASVLEGNSDEEPIQPEVVDMENTQASSVEDTVGDAMRL